MRDNTRYKSILFIALLLGLITLLAATGCQKDSSDDDDDDIDGENQPIKAAQDLADTWMDTWDAEDHGWSWDSGILMMGFWELGQATGEQRYKDYVRDWLDSWIDSGYTIAWSDHCPPGLLALRIYLEDGDPEYRAIADDVRSYIFERADRTSDGGLNHMGFISGNQIWVDTLFMVTPFLLELGQADSDQQAFDEAALQIKVFQNHLQDPETGLFRHAYDDDEGALLPPEPLFWGRGNGWALVAMANALKRLPADHPDRPLIRDSYDRLLQAILPLADPDTGRWHTVLNRPESYLETSIGALFSWGMNLGIETGTADQSLIPNADEALQATLDQIVVDESGDTLILGTSYGTSPGDLAHYQEVLKGENVAYGIGIYIMAAIAREQRSPDGRLDPPRGTDETYIHPPQADSPLADWGTFYVARGRFSDALETYDQALGQNPADQQAAFGSAAVIIVRAALDILDQFNLYSIGEIDLDDIFIFLQAETVPRLQQASALLANVENDPAFQWPIQRLLILESGGHTALGAVEFDAGEALLFHSVAELVTGVAYLGHLFSYPDLAQGGTQNGDKSIGIALDHLILGIDYLIQAIDSIMAETDDQSDDVLPKNLFMLEGDFGLPGILPPTPIDDLLQSLGIDPAWLEGLPMPETLLGWLETANSILRFLRGMFP